MARTSVGVRILAIVIALALITFSVGFSWAVVDDYSRRDIVPKGATVEGVPVGGLTRQAALERIEDRVEKLLLAPLTVGFHGKTFTLDASDYMSVDTSGMVGDTFIPAETATLARRVMRRVTGESVSMNVTRKIKIDTAGIGGWIAQVSAQVDTRPVDTTITVTNNRLVFRPSAVGWTLDRTLTTKRLANALRDGRRDTQLKVDPVKPGYTEASLGKSILVVKSERHLYLYNRNKLERDYPCAIGTPGHPTPEGWWSIENKRYMPSWTNPGSAWAAGMPSYISPGYNNPLGTRALDLNASGIRIHGSSKDYSIGTAASHGCMRMHMPDIEDLYPRVSVGTRVIIIP